MGFYSDVLLPRLTHWTLKHKEIRRLRVPLMEGLSGTVLEIGFGSGLNVPLYPREVGKLYAVEPSAEARRLAGDAIAQAPFPVEFIGDTAESIPLPDGAVDAVVSTWTLCTIPDVERALLEVRRVLRPGGRFRFVEHGLAPDPGVARWQHRLTPIQKRFAGGCHLDRPIDQLVAGAGFRLDDLKKFYIRGPKIASWMYQGTAGPPA